MNFDFGRAGPFLPYLRMFRGRLMGLAALMAAASLLEGAGVALFYPLIEFVQEGPAFLSHGAGAKTARLLAAAGQSPSVPFFIACIFCVIVLALAVKLLLFLQSSEAVLLFVAELRREALRRTLHSHFFSFLGGSSAALVQTIESETDYVGNAFNFFVVIISAGLSLGVYILCALAVSWRLTLLIAALGAIRFFVSGVFVRRMHVRGREAAFLRERLKSQLLAVHQGIDVIKSVASESREAARFAATADGLCGNTIRIDTVKAANQFSSGLLGEGLLCLIVYAAVTAFEVSGATLLTLLFIVSRIIPKISVVNDSRVHLSEFLSKSGSLGHLLSGGGLPPLKWGDRRRSTLDEGVRFEGVTFRYPETEADAVSSIDLTIPRGHVVALVGESGSGKSTLARLLLRLFDPTAGRVLIDGIPLTDLRREDWTALVSVVAQETFIFDDTVNANIRYGSPDVSDEDVRWALRTARADGFVDKLPQGGETILGERGISLSGGERQRISIARAVLRRSPILVLDEATSAMDSATEALIREALDEISRDRTVLIIAHRLTTVRRASSIVVLERGRIAESGTHEQLLERRGLYHRFFSLQTL